MLSASLRRASTAALRVRAFSSTAAAEELVLFEQVGKVGVLTLNDPSKLNALTVKMGDSLAQVLESIAYEKTNALVVRGAGRAFSAGGDFSFLNARAQDSGMRNSVIMRGFYDRFLTRIRSVPVPVVAAINGPAIGAGLGFALGADLRVAAKNAKMGITFVGLGLHPGMGTTFTLTKLVGPQLAARLALTGDVITGEEAARMGLVLEALEEDKVVPRAMELADRIAAQAPVAVRSAVRSLRLLADEGMDRALWREADAQSYSYSGADLKEGVAATAGKRKPVWTQFEQYKP